MQICVHLCRSDAGPLLEVELELVTPDMVWKPELGGSEKGTVQGLVERWLTSFLEVSGIKAAKSCLHMCTLARSCALCCKFLGVKPQCRPDTLLFWTLSVAKDPADTG